MKAALPIVILIALIFFGAYSVAPMFRLDELYPELLGSEGTLGRWTLLAVMLIGGLVWRGWWMGSRKRRGRND